MEAKVEKARAKATPNTGPTHKAKATAKAEEKATASRGATQHLTQTRTGTATDHAKETTTNESKATRTEGHLLHFQGKAEAKAKVFVTSARPLVTGQMTVGTRMPWM